MHAAEAQRRAADRVTVHQLTTLALPRRFSLPMQEIWLLQSRFPSASASACSACSRIRVFAPRSISSCCAQFASDEHAEEVAFWREAQAHPSRNCRRSCESCERPGRGGRRAAQAPSPSPQRHRRRRSEPHMRACIGLGGNLGDAVATLHAAIGRSRRAADAAAARSGSIARRRGASPTSLPSSMPSACWRRAWRRANCWTGCSTSNARSAANGRRRALGPAQARPGPAAVRRRRHRRARPARAASAPARARVRAGAAGRDRARCVHSRHGPGARCIARAGFLRHRRRRLGRGSVRGDSRTRIDHACTPTPPIASPGPCRCCSTQARGPQAGDADRLRRRASRARWTTPASTWCWSAIRSAWWCRATTARCRSRVDDIVYHTACVARGLRHALLVARPAVPGRCHARARAAMPRRAACRPARGMVKLEGAGHKLRGHPLPGRTRHPGVRAPGPDAAIGAAPGRLQRAGARRARRRKAASRMRARWPMPAPACWCSNACRRALAAEITARLAIPTIGIGAGRDCDGQVLVLHDLLGIDSGHRRPKFVKDFLADGGSIDGAVRAFAEAVRDGSFPDAAARLRAMIATISELAASARARIWRVEARRACASASCRPWATCTPATTR